MRCRAKVLMLLVALNVLGASGQVFAAPWYRVNSYVACKPSASYSITSWGDQPVNSWGYVNGRLWWWSGSSWVLQTEGSKTSSGSNNDANVVTGGGSGGRYFDETGAHTASFFSGTKNTDSGYIWCN